MEQAETAYKAVVSSLYREVLGQGCLEQLPVLVASNYRPQVPEFAGPDVLEPGIDALVGRLGATGPLPNEVKRIIADGDLVFAHVRYPAELTYAGVDIFRFDEDGRICEHWNVRQPLAGETSAESERFAGTQTPTGLAWGDSERLKQRICEMLSEMWSKGNADLVPEYYDKTYLQHNSDMPGGYRRILEVVQTDIRRYIEATGSPFPVRVHRIGAEGDMVFVHLSLFMAGINRNAGDRSTNVDIFRVNEQGRMVEHWDILQMESETLPAQATVF